MSYIDMINIERIIESILEAHVSAMKDEHGNFWILISDFIKRVNGNFESLKLPYRYKFEGKIVKIDNLTLAPPDPSPAASDSKSAKSDGVQDR